MAVGVGTYDEIGTRGCINGLVPVFGVGMVPASECGGIENVLLEPD